GVLMGKPDPCVTKRPDRCGGSKRVLGTTVPYLTMGRGPGTPFGPDRVPPVTGSRSVVYWVPRAPSWVQPPSSQGLSTVPPFLRLARAGHDARLWHRAGWPG